MDFQGEAEIAVEMVRLGQREAEDVDGLAPGRYIKLGVRDTGSGIEPEVMDQIFEPYFTTKEFGKGSGLGLAVVYGVVNSYGGAVTVDSKKGKGTKINIYLPVTDKVKDMAPEKVETLPSGTEHILLSLSPFLFCCPQ